MQKPGTPSPVTAVSEATNGDILRSAVEGLRLSVRAANCLRALGVGTVEELVTYRPEDLLRTRNLGATTLQEITRALANHGLRLGMDKNPISTRVARTPEPLPADTTGRSILSSGVHVLNLGVRASNCLQALGVHTVGELIQWNAPDLVRTRNLGSGTLQEIIDALDDHGLALVMDPRTAAECATARGQVFRQTLSTGLATAEAELDYVVTEVIAPAKRSIMMLRLGWSGQRIRTLKELAKDPELSRLGKRVSRERIRQIESTGKRAIRHRLDGICPRRISEALRIVTESTPIAVGDVPDLLRKHGVSRVGLHYSGVRNAVELAGTEWPLVPLTTRGNRVLILTGERARYRRALRILSSTRPMAHSIVGQTARLARGRSAMATLLTRLIDAHPDYQWLDRDTGVYWHAPDGRPRRSNNILYQCRKLFSVCGRLHLDEIHGAIRRTRTGDELPPAHVLLEMIRQTNWCLIDGNYVQLRHDIRFDELTTTDRRVVRAVAGMGSTMAFAELRDNLMRQGITSSHAGQHIISSPFLYPVARGRYRILFHADDSIAALG